jgi:4-hydroxybenzoate polyprenyltransferase
MLFMISVGATFLMAGSLVWSSAIYLGIIVFSIWSAVDAINNVFDVELDTISDPARAEFTKKLGKLGLVITLGFIVLSLTLGAATLTPYVFLLVALGITFGVFYSVPPFRLRKTVYKPFMNFTVGAVPVLIVAAFFNLFTSEVISLVLLVGVTTSVNSLWEDLADYGSDFNSGSRTLPIVVGFRKGVLITIILGYVMIPLMVFVGFLFQLGWIYYVSLLGLTAFVSLRVIQKRSILFRPQSGDMPKLHRIGEILAKDFVIVAIIFTLSLMVSSLLKISLILI